MKLRFFYDVVCPYAYLASQRVTDLAQRTGAELEWCPVLLGGLYRHHGGDQVPAQGWAHNKIQIGAKDLARQAAIHKVALTHNSLHPQRSVDAMRLILSAPQHTQVALTHALFRAYWVEGANINDSELLDSIAKSFDVDPTRRNTQAIKQELHYRTAAAADLGAFGVPAFEVGGKLWWGQDRMHFVEKALGGDPSLATDVGLSAKQDNGTLTFYHDFSSPYAYLAATQLEKQMTPLGITIEWRPILLGALFRAIGTPDVPLFAMSPAKMRYLQRDIRDWADWWGVDFSFAKNFPIRSVLALRVALQAPSATLPLYRAAWAEGQDISDPPTVARVLDEHGLNGEQLVLGAQQPAIKQALRDNTEAAQRDGACGVPSFVFKKRLIWGQDRIHQIGNMVVSESTPRLAP
jgi:2-hydroxychromene-2-carboxylate isomerase